MIVRLQLTFLNFMHVTDLGTFCDVLSCVILCWIPFNSGCVVCEQGSRALKKTYAIFSQLWNMAAFFVVFWSCVEKIPW